MKKEFKKVNPVNNEQEVTNKEESKSLIKHLIEKCGIEQVNFVRIIKNNTEIRRFTSLAVINYLKQKGIINGETNYVTYYWEKFKVSSDGLSTEYRYTEEFLINALIGSFASFANNASKIIYDFGKIHNIEIIVDNKNTENKNTENKDSENK